VLQKINSYFNPLTVMSYLICISGS